VRGAPLGVAVLLAVAGLVAVGVPIGIVLRYLAYWVGFIGLPGALVTAAAFPRRGRLWTVAVGAAVGYSLEILAWGASAAAGVRGALWAYPVLVAAPAAFVLWRRRRTAAAGTAAGGAIGGGAIGGGAIGGGTAVEGGTAGGNPRWWGWAVAGCAVVVLGLVVVWYWPANPWPVRAPSNYSIDLPFQLGWAADALHHFPPSNPSVAGVGQQYHWFFYAHLASSAQITGIDLPWLLLRLYVVPQVLLVPTLLAVAATRISGLAWAGPIAALTGTVAGELALFPVANSVVFAGFANYVTYSPTYLFGLLLLCALLAAVGEQLADRTRRSRGWWARWSLVALMLGAASGAKATTVPVLLGGLALATAYAVFRRRSALVGLAVGLVLTGGVAVGVQKLLYGGGSTARVRVELHSMLWFTRPFRSIAVVIGEPFGWGSTPSLQAQLVGLPFALALLVAPCAGALALVACRRHRVVQLFLVGVVLAGVGASSLVWDPQHSEHWFFVAGLPAGSILGGWGAAHLLQKVLQGRDAAVRATQGRGAAVRAIQGRGAAVRAVQGRAGVLAVGVVVVAAAGFTYWWATRSGTTPVPYVPPEDLVRRYAEFALGAVAVSCLAGLVTRRAGVAGACLVLVLLGASLARTPLQVAHPVRKYLATRDRVLPEGDIRQRADVTPELIRALDWIRTRTSPDDVIAVNNHCLVTAPPRPGRPAVCTDTRALYYSAFSQRRYLIESWTYADANYAAALVKNTNLVVLGSPFPARTSANDAAFTTPTRPVLDRLYREFRVRYLLADTRPAYAGGPRVAPPAALAELADVVYRTGDTVVYRLRKPA
jgi:hypothetical protein